MKKAIRSLAFASLTTLGLSVGSLQAQDQPAASGTTVVKDDSSGAVAPQGGPGGPGGGFGNWDPEKIQQEIQKRLLDGVRERLEIKDDTEWKAIEPLVKKVMDLRQEQMMGGIRGAFGFGGMGGMGGMGGRRPGGGQGGFPRFGPEPSAEETALSDAIENGSSKDILKEKMAAFRQAKAAKEAELKAAQDNLKKFLTTKQEAIALELSLVN